MSGSTLKFSLTPYDVCRYNFFCTGKWLFGDPLQRRPGLSTGLVCVGCVVEKVALRQSFRLSALFRQWSVLMYLSTTNLAIFVTRNTNKMQLCNWIYYSKVYWRLNMFRAAHRSSSGALNCICGLWFIWPVVAKAEWKLEIPTRCSFVIEFIIPMFIESWTYFDRNTAHHQEL
jgi:hypothetical protein